MPYKDKEKERERDRNRYHNSPEFRETKKNRTYARRKAMREWLDEVKSKMSCSICGENHISCLDFHHPDPTKKTIEIGSAIYHSGLGINKIQKEIEDCIVLCSNCHRKLHWAEKHPE